MCAHFWTWNQVSTRYIPNKFMDADIDDVNKAFAEMHEEVEQKVYKKDYEIAMS